MPYVGVYVDITNQKSNIKDKTEMNTFELKQPTLRMLVNYYCNLDFCWLYVKNDFNIGPVSMHIKREFYQE